MADIAKVLEEIKKFHSKGVNNANIIKLLAKKYRVRRVDIEIIIYTLENTDYKWNKRGAK